ncbi:MAG: helix-turn-helix transcriptional regulator [Tetragenococcus sp.]|nr:helix-turn-helix transcriptional regulator [Tetragenococcus sp.]
MPDNSLISRIVNLRESKNWSQVELGRKLSLDKSTMNKIESGTRKVSTSELEKIADIFDVSTDYLLGREYAVYDLPESKSQTVASHMGDNVSEDEMEDILNYIEFIKQKHRKK